MARPAFAHSRHRGLAAPLADRGEARKAFGCGCAQRHPLRRSRDRADRCADAVRGAGYPHRRPGRAGRPRHRHRHQQMGFDRARARRAVAAARGDRSPVAADQGRAGRRAVGAHRRGDRSADGGGAGELCGVEPPRADGRAQPLSRPGDAAHPPPAVHGRPLRLDYITQPKARPPTFVLFSSRAQRCPKPTAVIWSTACARISRCPARRSG